MKTQEFKLTNPFEIVRREQDGTHYYYINDAFYPSVTRILDEAAPMPYSLRNWLATNTPEQQEEVKNVSLGLGSKMHDAYERLLSGAELNLDKDYPTTKEKKHIMSFVQWFHDTAPQTICTEEAVASLQYKFAGTLDYACKIGGELWIIDFKTSAGIYYNYELQVAAYRQAYEEMYGVKVAHVGIVRTNTRHKCGYEFKEIIRPFQEFKNVYDTYVAMNGGKIPEPPLVDAYPQTVKLVKGIDVTLPH
jgi:hypothetical protein